MSAMGVAVGVGLNGGVGRGCGVGRGLGVALAVGSGRWGWPRRCTVPRSQNVKSAVNFPAATRTMPLGSNVAV